MGFATVVTMTRLVRLSAEITRDLRDKDRSIFAPRGDLFRCKEK